MLCNTSFCIYKISSRFFTTFLSGSSPKATPSHSNWFSAIRISHHGPAKHAAVEEDKQRSRSAMMVTTAPTQQMNCCRSLVCCKNLVCWKLFSVANLTVIEMDWAGLLRKSMSSVTLLPFLRPFRNGVLTHYVTIVLLAMLNKRYVFSTNSLRASL